MSQIEIITNELKNRKISQKQFCDSLQIGESTFSTWKMRNSTVPSKYIIPVCNFFDWPAEKLLRCEDEVQIIEDSNSNQINNITNSKNVSSVMNVPSSSGIDEDFLGSFKKLSFSDKVKVYALVA
ncbi:MAG: helix-turn-helix domain containing protein, partial [archaeon]|nr:helix-turn-helix domain containing protein [archaeon]